MTSSTKEVNKLEEIVEKIEKARIILNELVGKESSNLTTLQVVEHSQYLDTLIVEHLTLIKKVQG